jgi:hypothetical protein
MEKERFCLALMLSLLQEFDHESTFAGLSSTNNAASSEDLCQRLPD